jgi:DNA-binding NarL/FixJ family response regulator
MPTQTPIWIDDRDPIYRRGIGACLRADGYSIAGESASLQPKPDLSRSSVLVFDAESAAAIDRVAGLAHGCDVRLVGLVRDAGRDQQQRLLRAGLSGVLVRRHVLTPPRLLACVRMVIEGSRPLPAELLRQTLAGPPVNTGDWAGGHLAHRELDVLRLLADGDSTREIADQLSYSERTIKSVVHDLLVKLNCRTRAHAVAFAARRGVI